MSQVTVHKTGFGKTEIANQFFLRMEDTLEAVRRRAFQLFEKRGYRPGGEVGDWLQAERDLFFIPAAEMAEADKSFTMRLTMAGFAGGEVEVMTGASEIFVCAKNGKCGAEKCGAGETKGASCQIASKSLYRHFDMPATIDAGKVRARLEDGVLTIEAPKFTSQPVLIQSSAA